MSQQTYRLDLSQEVLAQIRALAEKNRRPVEEVIAESLSLVFGGTIAAEPEALAALSDKQLWMLVHERLEPDKRDRLHALLEKNQDAPLEGQDKADLDELQKELDRQTAVRVEALAMLKNRGHDIRSYLTSYPA